MRYGVHQYLFAQRWSDAALPILDRARGLGCDVVEIAVGDDVAFDPRATRRHAERVGLRLTIGPGGAWPMECDVSHDDAACRAEGVAWHTRMIDLAMELGAVAYCGALYGHPGRVAKRVPPADELPRTAENLHRLAEHAARRGVVLALEPMSRFRSHVVNTPARAMRVCELADHANLRVLLDTFHLVTEIRDYGAAIRACLPRLWGIHACENDRGVPGGGLVPWREVFAALAEDGRERHVLLETYNTAIPGFAASRGVFADLCRDPDEFTRRGLGFCRRMMAEAAQRRQWCEERAADR